MKRIETVDDLTRMREALSAPRPDEVVIRVCSTGCRALGALGVCDALDAEVAARDLGGRVKILRVGCHGLCAGAVAVLVDPKGIFYRNVTPEDAGEIIEQTVLEDKIVERLCRKEGDEIVWQRDSIAFYKHQRRLVLQNCGIVDPASLEDAVAHGAYRGAARALLEMAPDEIVTAVLDSGLRGRGGAGFPTGKKWEFARAAGGGNGEGEGGDEKYLICNADEGDPGAFMDRALLEGDPHLVLEGMIVAAYAIGASKGYIYVRAEYPIAIEHTIMALQSARQAGLLGENILGTGFDFDVEIRQGAGAFVCGEETALIASIEGKRGMPRPRPPFPAHSGLHDRPTNINNVETLANVPLIITLGAEEYASTGVDASRGTKVLALAGKVENTGLVEVPMGATLRQIVFDVGGGIPAGREFKAAQMGGPSGGCVPAEFLDRPIDYDSLQEIGAIMGSGGLIVMDETTCMVDIARFFTDFVQAESCGKCVPCRIGTKRMLDILTRITEGKGQLEDIDRLVELGEMVRESSLCGLGQTAPNPVLSTIQYFRDEYAAHVEDHNCPAGVCKALTTFVIDTEACKACGMCVKVCPTDAISDGVKKVPAVIDQEKCVSCGVCRTTCKFDAVMTSSGNE